MDVRVNRALTIPDHELEMRFSPSGGPGGQHANKASTRVELSWNVERSDVLSARQRQRLRSSLRHRMDSAGNVRIVADEYRSQMRNRDAAVKRLVHLLSEALKPVKQRVDTKPTRASKERRLQQKKMRSQTKNFRRAPSGD